MIPGGDVLIEAPPAVVWDLTSNAGPAGAPSVTRFVALDDPAPPSAAVEIKQPAPSDPNLGGRLRWAADLGLRSDFGAACRGLSAPGEDLCHSPSVMYSLISGTTYNRAR